MRSDEMLGFEPSRRAPSRPVRKGRPDAPLSVAVGSLLASKLDSELLLFDALAQVLRRYLDIARASIALHDPDLDRFEIVALALHEGTRVGKGWSIPHSGSRASRPTA